MNKKKIIIIGGGIAAISAVGYITYKMYLKDKFVDPGINQAGSGTGKTTSYFGLTSIYEPPQVGVRDVDFSLEKVETGVDRLTNKHTGKVIDIYCIRRKYDDNRFAVKDRNKCVKWKVGGGVSKFENRKKSKVIQTAYRMTL